MPIIGVVKGCVQLLHKRNHHPKLEHKAMERQINSFYYQRIISSKNKKGVSEETQRETIPDRYSKLTKKSDS